MTEERKYRVVTDSERLDKIITLLEELIKIEKLS